MGRGMVPRGARLRRRRGWEGSGGCSAVVISAPVGRRTAVGSVGGGGGRWAAGSAAGGRADRRTVGGRTGGRIGGRTGGRTPCTQPKAPKKTPKNADDGGAVGAGDAGISGFCRPRRGARASRRLRASAESCRCPHRRR